MKSSEVGCKRQGSASALRGAGTSTWSNKNSQTRRGGGGGQILTTGNGQKSHSGDEQRRFK